MKNNSRKTRFWKVLAMVNSLALLLPIVFLLQADNDPLRVLAILITYGTAFLLFIADTVTICCSYYLDS